MFFKNYLFDRDCNTGRVAEVLPNILQCIRKLKLATVVEDDPKAPFSIASTPRCRGERTLSPGLLNFILDSYFIMLNVKQGGIK